MKNILLIDKTPSAYRVKEIAHNLNIKIYEANTFIQALNKINSLIDVLDLIIIDVLLEKGNGFDLIETIKKEHPFIPIIILTSLNTKKSFVRGIKLGINDYILKPFDDETLINRIKKHTSYKTTNPLEKKLDFNSYLNIELKKASKGNYALSIGLFTFSNKYKNKHEHLEEYYKAQNIIYKRFENLFFETDFFTPYASKYFLVILPFCTIKNIKIVRSKIVTYGRNLLKELHMVNYDILTAFVTHPIDGKEKEELIDKLLNQINN